MQAGVRKINEISRCKDFEDYRGMSRANFNIILNHEARTAADDIAGRLGIPYLELTRLYQIDKIANQYSAFAGSIGAEFDDSEYLGILTWSFLKEKSPSPFVRKMQPNRDN